MQYSKDCDRFLISYQDNLASVILFLNIKNKIKLSIGIVKMEQNKRYHFRNNSITRKQNSLIFLKFSKIKKLIKIYLFLCFLRKKAQKQLYSEILVEKLFFTKRKIKRSQHLIKVFKIKYYIKFTNFTSRSLRTNIRLQI